MRSGAGTGEGIENNGFIVRRNIDNPLQQRNRFRRLKFFAAKDIGELLGGISGRFHITPKGKNVFPFLFGLREKSFVLGFGLPPPSENNTVVGQSLVIFFLAESPVAARRRQVLRFRVWIDDWVS